MRIPHNEAATINSLIFMKLLSALALGSVLALSVVPATVRAVEPTTATSPDVTALMVQINGATSPAARQKLIKDAIAANPNIASGLIAALISKSPGSAANLTKLVVDTVLGLSLDNTAKSEVLKNVAKSAVDAALVISRSSVDNLVNTVNAVKAALANVPQDFANAVAIYTTPITSADPRYESLGGGTNNTTNSNNNNNTSNIVSADTL